MASLRTFLLRVIAGLSSGRVWVGRRCWIGWCDWGEGQRFSTKQKLTKPTKIKLRNLSLIQSRSDPLEFNQDQLEKIKFWDGGDQRWVRWISFDGFVEGFGINRAEGEILGLKGKNK